MNAVSAADCHLRSQKPPLFGRGVGGAVRGGG